MIGFVLGVYFSNFIKKIFPFFSDFLKYLNRLTRDFLICKKQRHRLESLRLKLL